MFRVVFLRIRVVMGKTVNERSKMMSEGQFKSHECLDWLFDCFCFRYTLFLTLYDIQSFLIKFNFIGVITRCTANLVLRG